MDIRSLEKKVISIVKDSSKIYFNKSFVEMEEKHKYENDDVTNNDISTQEFLEKKLIGLVEDSHFIGEEGRDIEKMKGYVWLIDPIDGTVNYKKGVPIYGTQVALLLDKKPILSVIYYPVVDEMYSATEYGATLNGNAIHVSTETELNKSCIAISNLWCFKDQDVRNKIHNLLIDNMKTIRMFGCMSYNYVACAGGRIETMFAYGTTLWDTIPGQFLVEKAGGKVYINKQLSIHICGNEKVVKALRKMLEV